MSNTTSNLTEAKELFSKWLKENGWNVAPSFSGSHERNPEDMSQWLICQVVEKTRKTGIVRTGIVARLGDWGKNRHSGVKKYVSEELFAPDEKLLLEDEKKRETGHKIAADVCRNWLKDFGIPFGVEPYLLKKEISSDQAAKYGARRGELSGSIVLPLRDVYGEIWGAQEILANGEKWFYPGARINGCFLWIREPYITKEMGRSNQMYGEEAIGATGVALSNDYTADILICEGWATGVALARSMEHYSIDCFVACAFGMNNLLSVSNEIKKQYPKCKIYVCADMNRNRDGGSTTNPGFAAASLAASCVEGTVVTPISQNDFGKISGKSFDFHDLWVRDRESGVRDSFYSNRFYACETQYMCKPHINAKGIETLKPDIQGTLDCLIRDSKYYWFGESDKLYSWNGVQYEQQPSARTFIADWLQPRAKADLWPVSKIDEFIAKVGLNRRRQEKDWIQSRSGMINFRNGVLTYSSDNGGTISFREGHDCHTDFFIQSLPFDYDPSAHSASFEEYLANLGGDKEWNECLLQWLGFFVLGPAPSETYPEALCLLGSGGNGKSTFVNLIEILLGEENSTAIPFSELNNDRFLDSMLGKMLLICEEVSSFSDQNVWSEFRRISSGSFLQANPKYEKPFKFKNAARVIMTANEIPKGAETNEGNLRRMHFVKFEKSFTSEATESKLGRDILSRMKEELPGVFNAAVLGWKLWLAKGGRFTQSGRNQEALMQFVKENDSVREWMDENLEVVPVRESWLGERGLIRVADSVFSALKERGAAFLELDEEKLTVTGNEARGAYQNALTGERDEYQIPVSSAGPEGLYGAYASWAQDSGIKAVSQPKFVRNLVRALAQIDGGQRWEKARRVKIARKGNMNVTQSRWGILGVKISDGMANTRHDM